MPSSFAMAEKDPGDHRRARTDPLVELLQEICPRFTDAAAEISILGKLWNAPATVFASTVPHL